MFPFCQGVANHSINSCGVPILKSNQSLNIGCTLLKLYYNPKIIFLSHSKPYQFKIRFSVLQPVVSITNFVVMYNNSVHGFCCLDCHYLHSPICFFQSDYFTGCISNLFFPSFPCPNSVPCMNHSYVHLLTDRTFCQSPLSMIRKVPLFI